MDSECVGSHPQRIVGQDPPFDFGVYGTDRGAAVGWYAREGEGEAVGGVELGRSGKIYSDQAAEPPK